MKKIDCFFISPWNYQQGTSPKMVYEKLIREACDRASEILLDTSIETKAWFEISKTGIITEQVVQRLYLSDIVIADLTGANPNVFFELGARFSLRPDGTILIIQNEESIPFDISHYRVIKYNPSFSDSSISSNVHQISDIIVGFIASAIETEEVGPILL